MFFRQKKYPLVRLYRPICHISRCTSPHWGWYFEDSLRIIDAEVQFSLTDYSYTYMYIYTLWWRTDFINTCNRKFKAYGQIHASHSSNPLKLLRIQPYEDWQCPIVMLLLPTLLSLLFLTFLWHTNTCSLARMFFWTLSRRDHKAGILNSSVSLQLFNTTDEPMMSWREGQRKSCHIFIPLLKPLYLQYSTNVI